MDVIKDWLTNLIRGIVSHPDEVSVSCVNDEMGVLCTVKIHREDSGKVIGKGGEVARAIRFLLRYAGMQHQCRASLKIDVPYLPQGGFRNTQGQIERQESVVAGRDKDEFGL